MNTINLETGMVFDIRMTGTAINPYRAAEGILKYHKNGGSLA
jgi:hypothetical protein